MLPNRYHFSEWDADSDDEGDKDAVPTDKYPLIPEPNEEQLLFASPIAYGFSLSDKLWRMWYNLSPLPALTSPSPCQWHSTS